MGFKTQKNSNACFPEVKEVSYESDQSQKALEVAPATLKQPPSKKQEKKITRETPEALCSCV